TFSVKLPEGATVDVSLAAPVPSSGGTAVVVDATTAARDEAAATRAEAAAAEAEGYAPSFVWNGTALIIDGGAAVDLKGEPGVTAWADLTGKPATYPPDPHTHQIDDVDGLGTRLAIVGAGRPDVPGSMIGSVASAVAAAPSGATFVSTDGPQGAWQWQKRGTTWTVTGGIIAPLRIQYIDGTVLTTRSGISTTNTLTGDPRSLYLVKVLAVSSAGITLLQPIIPSLVLPV